MRIEADRNGAAPKGPERGQHEVPNAGRPGKGGPKSIMGPNAKMLRQGAKVVCVSQGKVMAATAA